MLGNAHPVLSLKELRLTLIVENVLILPLYQRALDQGTSNIYEQYESREEVEQVLDTMKGDLESDKTYLRDNEKVKGSFFIDFLALRTRFRIPKVLKDHSFLGKMSVNEVIFELSRMERIVKKSCTQYYAAVPKNVEKIVDLFRDMISMG